MPDCSHRSHDSHGGGGRRCPYSKPDPPSCNRVPMADPFNIALVGGGTVGGGVAKLLLQHPDRVAARAGRPVHLRRVVVRDPNKPRPTIPKELVSTDVAAAIHDPQGHVVVELIGGTGGAQQLGLGSLA